MKSFESWEFISSFKEIIIPLSALSKAFLLLPLPLGLHLPTFSEFLEKKKFYPNLKRN
jgi:hypothetical protein